MVQAVSGEMREVVGRREELVGSIGGKFEGCDNYGRERNNEEKETEERKKESLVALPSISIDSCLETDSTGTGSSNI